MVSPDPAVAGDEIPEVFPPTLREVMLRPTWIGMLLLCLVVAGVFAWLGQWQLARAIDTDVPPPGATEQVRPIEDVVEPGVYLPEPFVGQRVEATGAFVEQDFIVVSGRFNEGEPGYWVTGQFRVADTAAPTSLAAARRGRDRQLAEHLLRRRMGRVRRLRVLPLVPPGPRRVGARARGARGT